MVTKYRSKAEYTTVNQYHAERCGVDKRQAKKSCLILAENEPYVVLHGIAGLGDEDRKSLTYLSRIAMDNLGL